MPETFGRTKDCTYFCPINIQNIKNIMRHILLILLVALCTACAAWGQSTIKLPMTYGNSMVLQRERPIPLTCEATPGTTVRATLTDAHGKAVKTSAHADAKGHWTATLPAMPAGGPYTLTFTAGKEHRELTDVWVGEVWLCSGQSNMELQLDNIATARRDLATADTLSRLHLLNMPSPWPVYAQVWPASFTDSIDRHLVHQTGSWARCNAKTAAPFSAIAFHFGRVLADSLKCHVGLINNAVGGATTEGWIDSLSLATEVPEILQGDWRKNPNIMEWARQRADYNLSASPTDRPHRHPYAPTFLYDEALRPVAGYGLRGVIWYQGESNADLPQMHARLFPLLEKSWRKAFANPELPFITVQLSSIATRPIWPEFRNSQRLLADSLPNTWMAVSSDLGDSLDVHPRRKAPVGERLAASALHNVYGLEHVVPEGPKPVVAVLFNDGNVAIRFKHADGLRTADGKAPITFELAGSDGVFHPATATVSNHAVKLKAEGVDHPVEVRYGWQPFTHANLVNAVGYPCSTFRMKVLTTADLKRIDAEAHRSLGQKKQ